MIRVVREKSLAILSFTENCRILFTTAFKKANYNLRLAARFDKIMIVNSPPPVEVILLRKVIPNMVLFRLKAPVLVWGEYHTNMRGGIVETVYF